MTSKRQTPIPEYKKKSVKELNKLIEENKTILIASIKNIPASQFQEIVKELRGKAIVKIPKKTIINRVLDENSNSEIKKIKEKIDESFAILFSNLDSFELASELLKTKTPAKAKTGQEAPEDIEVQEGPTDLVPGPAVSELGALGIPIQIEKGKIKIKESKIIVKKGEKISSAAAEIMSKLDIRPFSIGFIPLVAYDKEKNIIYSEIKIDQEETIKALKYCYEKALPFAVEIGYICEETIKILLFKANAYANKINRIITGEPEPVAEIPVKNEENKEKKETKSEEEKAPAAEGLSALFG